MLFLFLDTSVNMHDPLSICFSFKQPAKPPLACSDMDIQPKIALVVVSGLSTQVC